MKKPAPFRAGFDLSGTARSARLGGRVGLAFRVQEQFNQPTHQTAPLHAGAKRYSVSPGTSTDGTVRAARTKPREGP